MTLAAKQRELKYTEQFLQLTVPTVPTLYTGKKLEEQALVVARLPTEVSRIIILQIIFNEFGELAQAENRSAAPIQCTLIA